MEIYKRIETKGKSLQLTPKAKFNFLSVLPKKAQEEIYQELLQDKDFIGSFKKRALKKDKSSINYQQILTECNTVTELLFRCNYRLVLLNAKSLPGSSLDDNLSAGTEGFMKGIVRYDVSTGHRLSTYVTNWIRQGIYRENKNNRTGLRLPEHIYKTLNIVSRIQQEHQAKTGQEPTDEQLRAVLKGQHNYTDIQINTLFRHRQAFFLTPLSLNQDMSNEGDGRDLLSIIPANIDIEEIVTTKVFKEYIDEVLDNLTDREKLVIRLRFGLDTGEQITLQKVADQLVISRERARQIEAQALIKLRRRHLFASEHRHHNSRYLTHDRPPQPNNSDNTIKTMVHSLCEDTYSDFESKIQAGRVNEEKWNSLTQLEKSILDSFSGPHMARIKMRERIMKSYELSSMNQLDEIIIAALKKLA